VLFRSLCGLCHKVFLASRDLSQIRRTFQTESVKILAAPWKSHRNPIVQPTATFADLLLNVGFADEDSLLAHVDAWMSLFELVEPDLMVCDHSPTAILAARGAAFPVATVGTGFFCPVDESPLRLLRNLSSELRPRAVAHESQLLKTINRILRVKSQPQVRRVTQLYHDAGIRHFLLTFRELDHYGNRSNAIYWGASPYGLPGENFVRPRNGPCIFIYLKPFPGLPVFLDTLKDRPHCSVVYIPGLRETDRRRFQSAKVSFTNGPVDIRQAADGCDIAITNANHGTCVAMLLAGKPLVQLPPFLEQELFAAATDRLGVSLTVPATDPAGAIRAIDRVFADRRYADAAAAFASRYERYRSEDSVEKIVDELEQLLHREYAPPALHTG